VIAWTANSRSAQQPISRQIVVLSITAIQGSQPDQQLSAAKMLAVGVGLFNTLRPVRGQGAAGSLYVEISGTGWRISWDAG
jgi:hypothetical protein